MTGSTGATEDASRMGWVVPLDQLDSEQASTAGAKAANLGELTKVEGVCVPDGFCITTAAFSSLVAADPRVDALIARIGGTGQTEGPEITELCAELQAAVAEVFVPASLALEVEHAVERHGPTARFAVRSSAIGEDSATTSFAGQFDTYLDVEPGAVVEHVRRCWASLFSEAPVRYRSLNRIPHDDASMAVVVQEMVPADAAGVAFTADPLTSDRTAVAIEATRGLGAALVAGREDPDLDAIRGEAIDTKVGASRRRSTGSAQHGDQPVLTDAQVHRLADLARRIEAHFGSPQDIEWCLADDELHIVQSRPITTLFPVPEAAEAGTRVFVSVGHQQMMTEAIRPLGISMWQKTAGRPMFEAGSRLFVDVTDILASPVALPAFLTMFERSDPLIGGALRTLSERRGYIAPAPVGAPAVRTIAGTAPSAEADLLAADRTLPLGLIERTSASIDESARLIADLSGSALFDFIDEDIERLKAALADPLSHQVVMAGMEAAWWINEHMEEWLGEKNAADVLSRAVAGNVTSEMGLALLDVADTLRSHPAVVAVLEGDHGSDVLDVLSEVPGGAEAQAALEDWLDRYGSRGVGEIDITRPRWRERPDRLVPVLLGHIRNLERGERARRIERGRREALAYERDLLERLGALRDGAEKVDATERMIDRIRAFAGYREYPKFAMVLRYDIYKRALTAEATRLVHDGVIDDVEDAFHLTFEELRQVVATGRADRELIRDRRRRFLAHVHLSPPRVMTSDGEVVTGSYGRNDLPAGALVGLPVSAGTVEGTARVIHDVGEADLAPGDILVTTFTDPSWTAVFAGICGLVTEVGGQMTHGAVIARELGLPAVVGVVGATRLIRDGQRIRVNGGDGVVEVLTST